MAVLLGAFAAARDQDDQRRAKQCILEQKRVLL